MRIHKYLLCAYLMKKPNVIPCITKYSLFLRQPGGFTALFKQDARGVGVGQARLMLTLFSSAIISQAGGGGKRALSARNTCLDGSDVMVSFGQNPQAQGCCLLALS